MFYLDTSPASLGFGDNSKVSSPILPSTQPTNNGNLFPRGCAQCHPPFPFWVSSKTAKALIFPVPSKEPWHSVCCDDQHQITSHCSPCSGSQIWDDFFCQFPSTCTSTPCGYLKNGEMCPVKLCYRSC